MKRFWKFIGSRDFSVVLFIMSITHVIVLFAFAFLIPTDWVGRIGEMLPYKLVFGLFFLNLLLCEIKWFPAIREKCRKRSVERIHEDFSEGNLEIHEVQSLDTSRFKQLLKRRGFRLSAHSLGGSNYCYGIKGRFSAYGSLVFHLGFFLLLAGIILNVLFRFEGQVLLPEGFRFDGNPQRYMGASSAPLSKVPKVEFFLDKINRSYWDGQTLFTELSAEIRHGDSAALLQLSRTTRIGGAELTFGAFGYAPAYVLTDKTGRLRNRNVAVLNIFAPGAEDFFQIPGYPHKVFISLYPDFVTEDGEPASKSMNLNNPVLSVRVTRGRTIVFDDLVKMNEEIEFDDHLLRITDLKRWGIFKVIAAPGRPYIWAAYIQMLLGLFLRLVCYRKEVFLSVGTDGNCRVAGRFDYYENLNDEWLSGLIEKAGGRTSS